jgi:hypothetical protein
MLDPINLAAGKVFKTTIRKSRAGRRRLQRQILTDCMSPIQRIASKRWFGLAETSRKTRIVGAGAVFLAVCAFGGAAGS